MRTGSSSPSSPSGALLLTASQDIADPAACSVAEASPLHLPPPALDTFMTRMLRSRISRRVITEQHIALTSQFRERQRAAKGKGREIEGSRKVGVVDVVQPAEVVRQCFELIKARGGPEGTVPLVLEGDVLASFE